MVILFDDVTSCVNNVCQRQIHVSSLVRCTESCADATCLTRAQSVANPVVCCSIDDNTWN